MVDGHEVRDRGSIQFIDVTLIHANTKKLRTLSRCKVEQYARDYENEDLFPPITVECCGSFYVIRDGRHRYQAQLLVGFTMIAVRVR